MTGPPEVSSPAPREGGDRAVVVVTEQAQNFRPRPWEIQDPLPPGFIPHCYPILSRHWFGLTLVQRPEPTKRSPAPQQGSNRASLVNRSRETQQSQCFNPRSTLGVLQADQAPERSP